MTRQLTADLSRNDLLRLSHTRFLRDCLWSSVARNYLPDDVRHRTASAIGGYNIKLSRHRLASLLSPSMQRCISLSGEEYLHRLEFNIHNETHQWIGAHSRRTWSRGCTPKQMLHAVSGRRPRSGVSFSPPLGNLLSAVFRKQNPVCVRSVRTESR